MIKKTSARIRREAQAFLIWREGKSVDWDCTISDLVEATGISRTRVCEIVLERRWRVEPEAHGRSRGFHNTRDHLELGPAEEAVASGSNLFETLLGALDHEDSGNGDEYDEEKFGLAH